MDELKGGSYVVTDAGRVRVEGTEDHPEGNRPRDETGRPLDAEGKPVAPAAPTEPPAADAARETSKRNSRRAEPTDAGSDSAGA